MNFLIRNRKTQMCLRNLYKISRKFLSLFLIIDTIPTLVMFGVNCVTFIIYNP